MKYMSDREIDRISGAAGKCLAAEQKVRLVIAPVDDGQNAPWECGLNGYFFRIPRGVPVQVPESLARLIQENARAAELSRAGVREYSAGRGKRLGA